MTEKRGYRIAGLMSGSSLDGLDLAICHFEVGRDGSGQFRLFDWSIESGITLPYDESWQQALAGAIHLSGKELIHLHTALGAYWAELLEPHLDGLPLDAIASHGHTVFHEPEAGYTLQIGDGAYLATKLGYPLIEGFRYADIAAGGQGAPIAPIADKWLFPEYDLMLNIGGIANITCNTGDQWIAFDICGANQILNALAGLEGKEYDADGKMASEGILLPDLYTQQASLPFFGQAFPKSLSNEWVARQQTQVFLEFKARTSDRLYTACQLSADLIVAAISELTDTYALRGSKPLRLLLTGGGAFNGFLVEKIRTSAMAKGMDVALEVPDSTIVAFKEAAMIALMGVFRLENQPNCISSVTGAERDSIAGVIHQGWKNFS